MSRSRQRTPITGNCVCRSEKDEKRTANRKLRRKTREALRVDDDPFPLPVMREVSNAWLWGKDGKSWRGYWLTDPSYASQPWRWFGK